MHVLALDNFPCIASPNSAGCRQVELNQIDLFQHVGYANSLKKLETFFCLILYIKKIPHKTLKLKFKT